MQESPIFWTHCENTESMHLKLT